MKTVLHKLIFVFLAMATSSVAMANTTALNRQEQFKAVYLFHFANFIKWPASSSNDTTHFNICILGKTSIGEHASEIDGETIKSKNKTITLFNIVSLDEISPCKIVFFSDQELLEDFASYEHFDNKSILLVSDIPGFANHDGDIEYFIKNNKLRFAININNVSKKNLTVSSKLLRLAKIIGDK